LFTLTPENLGDDPSMVFDVGEELLIGRGKVVPLAKIASCVAEYHMIR
jgi:hypothetical protein